MVDGRDGGVQGDRSAHLLDLVTAGLPHHAGAVLRVVELLDQAGDVLLVSPREDRVDDRGGQREVLHPLRGPIRRHLTDRDSPQLLGVGFEERPVQSPAEARDQPRLVVALIPRRTQPRAGVGPERECRVPRPEVA